jgi:hypothetical protein
MPTTNRQCAGSFKSQHDTGKNLKFLHVFPKATVPEGSSGDGEGAAPNMDPAFLALTASEDIFHKMVTKKMPAWAQKRRCNQYFKQSLERLQKIEAKLFRGDVMTAEEQELYQETNIGVIENKQKFLQDAMKDMVDKGQLTADEKKTVLAQIDEKLSKGTVEVETAAKEGKAKRVAKLKAAMVQMEARKTKISDISGITHALADLKMLQKAWTVQIPLERHCPQHMLGEKEEIGEKVDGLLSKSRSWFEEEDEYAVRVAAAKTAMEKKLAKPSKAKPKSKSSGGRCGKGNSPRVDQAGFSSVGSLHGKQVPASLSLTPPPPPPHSLAFPRPSLPSPWRRSPEESPFLFLP